MILYVETNFLMGVAMGRDTEAEHLFRIPNRSLRVALPSTCIMEAFSAFEDEQSRRRQFEAELDRQLSTLNRDRSSANAQSLRNRLDAARLDNRDLLNDIDSRLRHVVRVVAGQQADLRGAELIPLTPDVLRFADTSPAIPSQPTDSLIPATISEHAQRHPDEQKVLLSENTRDLDRDPVRAYLAGLQIRFSPTTANFLGWFNAQSGAAP